jgi:cell division septation protein DedD
MKDDQASEEKLMKELDRMYIRVADLESGVTKQDIPDEYDQDPDRKASNQQKVIPFPVRGIHVTSGQPSGYKMKRKRKPWYRSYLMVSFVIFLLLISLIILTKLVITPRDSENAGTHQLTFPIRLERSAPGQTKDTGQGIENKEQESALEPEENLKPAFPLPQEGHYTVQVGAFCSLENARNLIEALRKKGLEGYWAEINTENRGTLYRVYSGYFMDKNEASRFMRERGILKDLPDSFVREIVSNEGKHD